MTSPTPATDQDARPRPSDAGEDGAQTLPDAGCNADVTASPDPADPDADRPATRAERRAARRERRSSRRANRRERTRSFGEFLERKSHAKPLVVGVYLVLRLLVVAGGISSFFFGQYENVLVCALVLTLFMLPSILEHRLRIVVPDLLEVVILFFIFAAEFLGEIQSFYVRFPFWDTMLHTLWGFLCAGIGFAAVDVLNRSSATRIRLTPAYMAFAAVTFSMCVGAIWEIFEFSMDTFLGFDMQKDTIVTAFGSVTLDPLADNNVVTVSDIAYTQIVLESGEVVTIEGGYLDIGILDTMEDLIVNLVGSIIFAIIGYAYVKTRDETSLAAHLIPKVLPRELTWRDVAEITDAMVERGDDVRTAAREAERITLEE